MWFAILYVLSLLITASGALWLLNEELAADRRRILKGHSAEITWLKIVGGTIGVFLPIFNTIIAFMIICALLDRPVLTEKE